MGDYLIIAHDEDGRPTETARDLSRQVEREGFAVSSLNPRAWLAVRGPHPPARLAIGGWTLIGDVFNRNRPDLDGVDDADPLSYERKLLRRFWGRYVGVRFGADHRPAALLRDPSGAMECVAWTQDGLTLVCSAAPDWLLGRLRPAWRLDVDRLAGAIRDPVPSTGALLIQGPTALAPGAHQTFPLGEPASVVWRPVDFARRSLGASPAVDVASASVRSAIDEAVAGLAGLGGPLACEVSGGLDSSIVASALVHAQVNVPVWLNAYGETPESDERAYVGALARQLGIKPACVPHAVAPLTQAGLEDLSTGLRPGLTGLDRAHELDWAERLGEAGIVALMTGKGGDSVLLNRGTSDIFTDDWRRRSWRSVFSRDAWELAAANEISVWSLIARARRQLAQGVPLPRREHAILPSRSGPTSVHPWIEDWAAFGPSKAMHIASMADNVARHAPSLLTRTVDLRHPLCAQPVVEACLALPASVLTTGGRERGLARRAFAGRLPPEIVDRRSKGDMTKFYGRMIVDGLDLLRPWLIDGRLAELGVIDRAAAEAALTREALAWRGGYSAIMVAAAFESWVRNWERRLSTHTPD